MSKILLKGIFPALPTVFDKREHLITRSIEKIMDYGYSHQVNGFYVGGATGEGPVLTAETRIGLFETVIAHNQDRGDLILHVGGPNFEDVKSMIAFANRQPVTAVSAMAPNAYYSHSDKELVNYYKTVAELSEKPVLIYVTPLMLGNNMNSVFSELIETENIIGLKFTLPNYYQLSILKMLRGGDINVINGPDETLICGLSMGADGGIGSTYNLMPDKFVSLYRAFSEGNIDRAKQIQYDINKVIRVLLEFGAGNTVIKNLKTALSVKLDCDMGCCAFPCVPLSEEEKRKLFQSLSQAGLQLQ